MVVGNARLVVSPSMQDVTAVRDNGDKHRQASSPMKGQAEGEGGVVKVDSVADLDYAMMDRMIPVVIPYAQ